MSTHFRGVTWDHPRGRAALERVAAMSKLIEWDAHPLEGFESHPIEDLAARFDLMVIDHPHLGDAIATGALQPAGPLLAERVQQAIASGSHGLSLNPIDYVGPSIESYTIDGTLWALPLDAATQVSVRLPEKLDAPCETWDDVIALTGRANVALSLAGPHAFLSFTSIMVALGAPPHVGVSDHYVSDPAAGLEALRILRAANAAAPAGTAELNPIGLLERMRAERDIDYIPLIYGYVNYATGADSVTFGDAPSITPGGRIGSVIGGTGIAVSARTQVTPELIDLITWLLHPISQATAIPDNHGQPSRHDAWTSENVNARHGDFYAGTLETIDQSWVRPRVPGFTPFQTTASATLRAAVLGEVEPHAALDTVNALYGELTANIPATFPLPREEHE